MSEKGDEPDPTIQPTEEMIYRANVDLELASLRIMLTSLIGVVAARTNTVEMANGIVRQVEQTSKDALATYPVDSDVYNEDDFRRRVKERISGILDALRFSK